MEMEPRIASKTTYVVNDDAALPFVLNKANTADEFATNALPPLKPTQSTHSKLLQAQQMEC
jgi:hypothetical protein